MPNVLAIDDNAPDRLDIHVLDSRAPNPAEVGWARLERVINR